MRKTSIATIILAGALAAMAYAQTAPSSSAPAAQTPAELPTDKTRGKGTAAAAPNAPAVALQREGTYIFDRRGHLARSADGSQAEFTFAPDGKTVKDPPVIILPNLKLMTMEEADRSLNRDLLFRVTGMLTEYRGRNYLLVDKVVVPPELNAQF